MNAKAYLVGAGPGAVDLITLRGYRILRRADVVLYDRLANPELLSLTRKQALLIDVGKKPAEPSASRQRRIGALMVHHASKGKTVVRLKGGDPFVFGRGCEELLSLQEAGIETEVVPGISSCIAAPMAAGIPVTHRGTASSFGVFSGHPADGDTESKIDWHAAARVDTAVFLMGVALLETIVRQLIRHGRPPNTPAAMVELATLPSQSVVTGTLGDIHLKAVGIRAPSTLIVGHTVALGQQARKPFPDSSAALPCTASL